MRSLIALTTLFVLAMLCGCGAENQSSPKPQNQSSSKPQDQSSPKPQDQPSPKPQDQSSPKPQDLIIGNWTWTGVLEGKTMTITNEFTEGGVVKVVQGGIPFQAKYRFVDDSHIEYDVMGQKQVSKVVSITRDKLVVVDERGAKREWTRP